MINADISPYFAKMLPDLHKVEQDPQSLFTSEATSAIQKLNAVYSNTDDLIEAVIAATKVSGIYRSGLHTSTKFRNDYDQYPSLQWSQSKPLPTDIEKQEALGTRLYNVPNDRNDAQVLVMVGPGSNAIVKPLLEKIIERQHPFIITMPDETYTRLIMTHADEEGIAGYADFYIERHQNITHKSIALPNAMPPSSAPEASERHRTNAKAFSKKIEPLSKRGLTGEMMFTLTYFPTPTDAEIDGIPYDEYLDLYFEMCDQPDAWIEKANEHLIAKLERASTVRFTNKWGTDISMSLIDTDRRHFTFANSQTKKNIPGSEVFSAPRRDSINGVIVSRGKFLPKSDKSKLIENLTMRFENGKIVSFKAEQGAKNFQEFLDRAPNNSYVGELGIGTNPHLKRHVANGLLVEKVSSSFHLALGEAYQITNYLGKEVHMNNGNDSLDHWDVTTMLGDMYLDDEIVMKDGKFLDAELDVLNRGWDAIPVEDRPERWKNYKGPYYGSDEKSQ
jgi:aminopeptidase